MPVTNFEKITVELNEKELAIIPSIIQAFGKYTKENPIKAPQIVSRYNASVVKGGIKLSEPRLRKIVNHIRSFGLLPLIATSNGYYVSYDKEEIQNQITSLHERANSIMNCAVGLEEFL
jgi:hypothetical protein